jgi:hypothetical protein
MSGELAFSPDLSGLLVKGSNSGGATMAFGVHTTLSADDTVDTGLSTVTAVVVSLVSDPIITCASATAALSATVGSVDLKTWSPTASGNATPTPAATFTKVVHWVAYGTK